MLKSLFDVSSKVVAWLAFLATVIAIVGGLTLLDDRYARANDVQKTQTQFIKAFSLINLNLELINLKNQRADLKAEKRTLITQLDKNPTNMSLKLMLDDVEEELSIVCRRIGELENKKVLDD